VGVPRIANIAILLALKIKAQEVASSRVLKIHRKQSILAFTANGKLSLKR
jgi:hypothetical protein